MTYIYVEFQVDSMAQFSLIQFFLLFQVIFRRNLTFFTYNFWDILLIKVSGFILCPSVHCVLSIQVEIIEKDKFY